MRIIKRYKNRKYYDTLQKRYINLNQIADLTEQDEDISIIDIETGKDITSSTLFQILAVVDEYGKSFPISILRSLLSEKHLPETILSQRSDPVIYSLSPVNDEIRYRLDSLVQRGLIRENLGEEVLPLLIGFSDDGVSDRVIEEEVYEHILQVLKATKEAYGKIEAQLNHLEEDLDQII